MDLAQQKTDRRQQSKRRRQDFLRDALMPYKLHLKTITSGNGKEFTKLELISCKL